MIRHTASVPRRVLTILLFLPVLRAAEAPRLTEEQAGALCRPAATAATADAGGSFAPLLEKATPAVVSVFPAMVTETTDGQSPIDRFFGAGEKSGESSGEKITGLGSGVILSADGWIVTNSHVVHLASGKVADRCFVELHDHRRFPALIAGVDPPTDLALLKIETEGLSSLAFADSDAIRTGDRVFAIGNPFEVGMTATMGMVSATRRSNLAIGGQSAYQSFIQTDAAINPGNSGGALIDLGGSLAGINTAIYGTGGGNVGIGFAIPANLVKHIVSQLAARGTVSRGFFGIQTSDVDVEKARMASLPRVAGAFVDSIMDDSPAALAGIKSGDIIIKAAGKPVIYRGDLRFELSLVKPGADIALAVWREGAEISIRLTAASEPAKPAEAEDLTVPSLPGARFARKEGVLRVTEVTSNKLRKAGLEIGMTILEANGSKVDSLDAFANALRHGVNQVRVGPASPPLTLALEAE